MKKKTANPTISELLRRQEFNSSDIGDLQRRVAKLEDAIFDVEIRYKKRRFWRFWE